MSAFAGSLTFGLASVVGIFFLTLHDPAFWTSSAGLVLSLLIGVMAAVTGGALCGGR